MSAMWLMLLVLAVLAIAYRYYSGFLAAKVLALDDSRVTPALRLEDGQNFEPTNRWVLFGHHFAAISGAGPLIGPVLAAQFGYLPGLLWIVVGVCIGGAVQDFLVLTMSTRRNGRSLAQIALAELGKIPGTAVTIATLFIIVIALAGLGKVVVKALGGENVNYPAGSTLIGSRSMSIVSAGDGNWKVPPGTTLQWGSEQHMEISESFTLHSPAPLLTEPSPDGSTWSLRLPPQTTRIVPGSAWGTFTIASTIPIALFVGLYMYRLRPGKVLEASIIGGILTLAATVAGGWVAQRPMAQWFTLSASGVTWSMAIYGFIAAVLPVWILLCPRDFLSSFLKIGTISLLVGGVILANPKMETPAYNHVFAAGGPTVRGQIFPFLFITIMCGAISGFHALVSSGTTPKMIRRESDARMIGYGAMLIEGLVAVVAMIAACTLPVRDYYAMNTELALVPQYHDRILEVSGPHGIEDVGTYETLTNESLRGRTGGAVTLAVGMARIFDGAARRAGASAERWLNSMWKYWYHFAIMFEALFILTTIDAGTRIARFLFQEVLGNVHPALGIKGGWLSAIGSTAVVVVAWALFMNSDSFATVWAMFGIANQMLAVIALAVVTGCLANTQRMRFSWVTIVPLCFVFVTTASASVLLLQGQLDGIHTQLGLHGSSRHWLVLFNACIQASLIVALLTATLIAMAGTAVRCWIALFPTTTGGQRVEPAAG